VLGAINTHPLARPTTSSRFSHSCPGAYNPLSSTLLLSPLVRNFVVPSSLYIYSTWVVFTVDDLVLLFQPV